MLSPRLIKTQERSSQQRDSKQADETLDLEDSRAYSETETIDEIQVEINKRLPEKVPCPYCRKTNLTLVTRERSTVQVVWSTLLCLVVLLLWPCACMVWRNPNLMDYHHSCPSCHSRISTHNPRKARKEAIKVARKSLKE